jgi:phosphoserine phosphatase RsbU/P
MQILIAEDEPLSRRLLEIALEKSGHTIITSSNGNEVMERLNEMPSVSMAILDWMMPGRSGLDVCKEIKARDIYSSIYVIMLTAKNSAEELAEALDSGADDFIAKPFNALELRARIRAGERMVRLHKAMLDNIAELQTALTHVRQLQGILPICAWCKRIRDDHDYWTSVEEYITKHSQTEFTHSICPECAKHLDAELGKHLQER